MRAREYMLADAAATERLGAALASALGNGGAVVYLCGDLGTGKTTLSRALLQVLGHAGRVRSPTYTLVEPYEIGGQRVFHLDLYRLSSSEELEYLGLRDLDPDSDLILIEWPQRVDAGLPPADLTIWLEYRVGGRYARLETGSERGTTILSGLGSADHLI